MTSNLIRIIPQKDALWVLRALGHQVLTFSPPSCPTLGKLLVFYASAFILEIGMIRGSLSRG